MKLKTIIPLLSVLFLGVGCISPIPRPTSQEIATADYGAVPDESVVRSYIRLHFKDPDSVKDLTILPPQKECITTRQPLINGGQISRVFCYHVLFRCNAKNSYGGYAGSTLSHFYVRNGIFVPGPTQ